MGWHQAFAFKEAIACSYIYVTRTSARVREMEIKVDIELDQISGLEEDHFRAVLTIKTEIGVGYLEELQLS
jgi:hypothetical protein